MTTTYFQEFNSYGRTDGSYRSFLEEEAAGAYYSLFFNYVTPRIRKPILSRFEGAVGAGIIYGDLSVSNYFQSNFSDWFSSPDSIEIESTEFSVNKNVAGLHVQASADFYVAEWLSLQFKIAGRFLPRVEVPEYRYFDLSYNTEKVHTDHKVDFSTTGISCGLRFHF
jgi:hypothetical protein